MRLHGFPMSPNTRRALLMLEECGAPYELVAVDLMSAAHRAPPYLELNPTARVPTLEDGALRLWESNAILEYLAARYPERKLGGQSPEEIGEIARWMFMNAAHLSPAVARIFAHTIRLPEDKRIPQLVEEGRAEVDRCLSPLDARLGGRDFVLDRLTIADLSLAPTLAVAPMLGIDLVRYPNVSAWSKRMAERPAWAKVYG